MPRPVWLWLFVILACSRFLSASEAGTDHAIDLYHQLRNPALGHDVFAVKELTLTRDAAVFTLHSGTLCLLAPADGVVTGAVFSGNGSISLETDSETEREQIKLLTKEPFLHEEFERLVLRFSDLTSEEIRQSGAVTPAPGVSCNAGGLDDANRKLRSPIRYNLAARLLQDVLARDTNGVFYAFIDGQKYSNKMLYVIDPHGVPKLLLPTESSGVPPIDILPEEVGLFTYNERRFGVWYARHLKAEYKTGEAVGTQQNGFIGSIRHSLDASIEKNGELSGTDRSTVQSNVSRLYVVPFDLYEKLRVKSVTDSSGQPLTFIQEDKNQDPQFSVVLAKPLQKGETLTVVTSYSGKDVVFNEGNANYYPVARDNWYPNTRFGDYADYELTLRVPKGLTVLATGKLLSQSVEGDRSVTKWKTEIPIAVAGFAMGGFREKTAKLQGADLVVSAYANTEQDQFHSSMDVLVPVAGIQHVLEEGMAASGIYTNVFGPVPFDHVALTQQTAPNYGQAWPELIFLPRTSFLETQLLLSGKGGRRLESVVPHEVAHQWWGHTVGWNSYRDQWMSEGFAEFSASLYVQTALGQDSFLQFWKDRRTQLTDRNEFGFRPIDVGPLTMGNRLATARAGFGMYSNLIYPKGAFVLHMLRMMMWTSQQGDAAFQSMMKDFVQTYRGKAVSTEDFQSTVEKHMTQGMDLTHDQKMDWFFNEWVRGTELPQYNFNFKFDKDTDGKIVMNWTLQQSSVSDAFQMPVPIYLELANKQLAKLGVISIKGNTTREGKVRLGNLAEMPKRALINYQYDVLCSQP